MIPFPDQILQFNETKEVIYDAMWSKEAAKEQFWRSLFLINIGGNDLVTYIFNQSDPLEEFLDSLMVILKASVEVGLVFGWTFTP